MGKQTAPKASAGLGVLLIDMQEGFCSSLPWAKRQRLVRAQQRLLWLCGLDDVPVAVIRCNNIANGQDAVEELIIPVHKVPRRATFFKGGQDAFSIPTLHDHLRRWAITEVILAGVYASNCVLRTAEGALERGYKIASDPTLIADGLGFESAETAESFAWYAKHGRFPPRLDLP